MQKPYIRMLFTNGQVWAIPAQIVAENRARYYAEKDPATPYEEELKYTLGDNYELTDWLLNEMNWVDVVHVAERLVQEEAPTDFQEQLNESEKKVIR